MIEAETRRLLHWRLHLDARSVSPADTANQPHLVGSSQQSLAEAALEARCMLSADWSICRRPCTRHFRLAQSRDDRLGTGFRVELGRPVHLTPETRETELIDSPGDQLKLGQAWLNLPGIRLTCRARCLADGRRREFITKDRIFLQEKGQARGGSQTGGPLAKRRGSGLVGRLGPTS